MHKKNVWVIIVAVVAVVLGVIAGIIIVGKKVAKSPEVSFSTSASSSTAVATVTASSSGGAMVTYSTSTPSKSYAGSSFSLTYPGLWTVSPTSFFSINSFDGHYQNGWMIPMGGAEIDVVTTTIFNGSADGIMTTEMMSATHVATSTATLDGVPCTKASFQNTYAKGVPSQNISLYCLRGTELWKIYFSYHAGDPAAATHIADFNNVMSSIKFLSR